MKKLLFSAFTALFICSIFLSVSAAEISEKINVGILYGSSAATEINVKASSSLAVGKYSGTQFEKLATLEYDEVKLMPNITDGANSYHVQYGCAMSEADAKAMLAGLKNSGIKAYTAYSNSGICVWEGAYKNQNDAQYAAQNCGYEAVAVASTTNSVRVMRGGDIVFVFSDSTGKLGIKSDTTDVNSEKITLKTTSPREYRGGLCLYRLNGGSTLNVSNILETEKYLYSVISKEMSPSWHKEALKAQAVCARNYAVISKGKHSEYEFDVCSSVCCQAYSGTESETAESYAPVDETCGMYLMYGDEVAFTVYSSSMGDTTENVKNVWGSNYPYLVSVSNEYEDTANIPNGVWEKTLTKAEATEIMNSKGYNIGEVTSIEVTEYSESGRAVKLKVCGTSGEKVFERESCRLAFGTFSQMYTVGHGGEVVDEKIYVMTANGVAETSVSQVAGKSSTEQASGFGSIYATDGKEVKNYKCSVSSGDPNVFVFKGYGWGHGVGMSQYGAKGMAENGFTYEQILTHYYSGTKLEKKY